MSVFSKIGRISSWDSRLHSTLTGVAALGISLTLSLGWAFGTILPAPVQLKTPGIAVVQPSTSLFLRPTLPGAPKTNSFMELERQNAICLKCDLSRQALVDAPPQCSRKTAGIGVVQTMSDLASSAASTIYVSSTAELLSALQHANGGEVISLAGGDYGDIILNNLNFESMVTIRSTDASDPATFEASSILSSSNITFSGVNFDLTPSADTVSWDSAVRIVSSSALVFENSTITGGPAINGVPPETEAGNLDETGNVLGLPTGRAFTIMDSSDITISNNDISQFQNGVVAAGTDGLNILDNEIHDLRASPVRGGDDNNVTLDGNHFYNFYPWQFGGAGDHGDLVHFWTRSTQDSASVNFTITNNFFEQGDGTSLLGIYFDDNNQGIGFSNVVISDNVIYNGTSQGIRLENVENGTISSNTLLQSSGDQNDAPTIFLRQDCSDLIIESNILSGQISIDEDTAANQVSTSNNFFVQSNDPAGEHYVGDLFVNPLAGANAELVDLQALPNGLVEQLGVGAALTAYGTTPVDAAGVIGDSAGSGFDLLHHSFEIGDLYNGEGQLDLTGAKVAWDFGDGLKSSGAGVEHSYAHAGNYDVTAVVTLASGEIVNLAKTIEVTTPVVLHADFDQGAQDLSDTANAIKIGNNVTFEANRDGQAVRLNGDVIAYQQSPDFFNNREYTVLVDFKKDEGHETSGGRIVNATGSFIVSVDANAISVAVITDEGQHWITAKNVGIDDSDWHTLALTFSGIDGDAVLYIDGNEVAHQDGLEGQIQTGSVYQPIYLGGPWGNGFTGLIDNFAFLKGAMSADQVAHSASTLEDILAHPADDMLSGSEGSNADSADGSSTDAPPVDTPSTDSDQVVHMSAIDGTDGNDHIVGTDGADDIYGHGGQDVIEAGAGDDTVHLGDQNWSRADGGNGNDTLYGGQGHDTLFGGAGDDVLDGGAGTDKLFGGDGNDLLIGGTGRDWLYGEAGNDVLIASDTPYNLLDGGDGNDLLNGGAATDYLVGGAGDDILIGGGGADTLTGGGGADQFVFAEGSGANDVLKDFNVAEDVLVLKGLGFQSVSDVIASTFESHDNTYLKLDGPDAPFSWSNSDYVCLVGVHASDLTDANICLVA